MIVLVTFFTGGTSTFNQAIVFNVGILVNVNAVTVNPVIFRMIYLVVRIPHILTIPRTGNGAIVDNLAIIIHPNTGPGPANNGGPFFIGHGNGLGRGKILPIPARNTVLTAADQPACMVNDHGIGIVLFACINPVPVSNRL